MTGVQVAKSQKGLRRWFFGRCLREGGMISTLGSHAIPPFKRRIGFGRPCIGEVTPSHQPSVLNVKLVPSRLVHIDIRVCYIYIYITLRSHF